MYVQQSELRFCEAAGRLHYRLPVSYTHLDVYKRQHLDRFVRVVIILVVVVIAVVVHTVAIHTTIIRCV